MTSLFPFESDRFPPGFKYIPDFLSEQEEKTLLDSVIKIPLHPFLFQGFEAKRKVASYGYDYHFDKRQLTKGNPFPMEFDALVKKVSAYIGSKPEEMAELLVTEYPPGAVINWHRDAPPFGLIAGVSLLSDCVFRLKPHDKAKQNRKAIISLPVQRRSLYVMEGEARAEWQHSILPVKATRYSITLRTLK